jgi:hypothetical protein
VRRWDDAVVLQQPERPWELMQLGNCGSPLETDAGWLVITHGVGPFRRYTLGALLLDLDDPTRVIGHLAEPLLSPNSDEREGYVPNVVYSCGSMIHGGHLILPYGYADVGAGVATIPVAELLARLTASAAIHVCVEISVGRPTGSSTQTWDEGSAVLQGGDQRQCRLGALIEVRSVRGSGRRSRLR